jgi:hypothetical protein
MSARRQIIASTNGTAQRVVPPRRNTFFLCRFTAPRCPKRPHGIKSLQHSWAGGGDHPDVTPGVSGRVGLRQVDAGRSTSEFRDLHSPPTHGSQPPGLPSGVRRRAARDADAIASRGRTRGSGGPAALLLCRSDKYWVTDPSGIAWEMFHTLASIPAYGEDYAGI